MFHTSPHNGSDPGSERESEAAATVPGATTIVVLNAAGLALALRLRTSWCGPVRILGPSCVVGQCGSIPADAAGQVFATEAEGVYACRGPLRLVFPEIWTASERIVAVMPLNAAVRLVAPVLAAAERRVPAVVAIDDRGRFALSVAGSSIRETDTLTEQVARTLGAISVVTLPKPAKT